MKEPVKDEFTTVDDVYKRMNELERELELPSNDASRRHQIVSELQALTFILDALKRKTSR